jgi:Trk K+ transport system NAD-binding subunit
MEGPIVLCGLGRMGWRVLEYLQAAGLSVVVIDTGCRSDDLRLKGARVVSGDCRKRETLESAGVAHARGVLVLTSDDLVNIATALMVRSLNADVRILIRMFNQNLLDRLGHAVRNVIALSTAHLTAPILATTALTGQSLGAFRVDDGADGLRQVAEVSVGGMSELRGRTIAEAESAYRVQVLAHLTADHGKRHLHHIQHDHSLISGDRLVICGEPGAVSSLLAGGGSAHAEEPLWAGLTRRLGRVARRTLADIDRAVLVCTLVLVIVIVLSSILMRVSVEKYSVPVALLRTISIMATGADMHEDDYQQGWMKVYVGALRLTGAALIAAFTAIVTNYLLRARLGGALEVRRIPDGGHIVVCGLGAVGFRVVEELCALRQPAVVVEVTADNRFVTTVRRLGVPVIIGDAAIREVLKQAHAGTARAVIASTTSDLVNLEVALLVRELNPAQRIVLLQTDPQLAQMLREGANVRLAVSVPALAAPAFVAALFGDRVQNVFLVGDRMLAVMDLVIHEGDTQMIGRTSAAVGSEYKVVPVAICSEKGERRAAEAPLQAGDRLVAFVTLGDLEGLLKRQGVAV